MSRGRVATGLAILDIAGSIIVSVFLVSANTDYLDATSTFLFVGSVLAFSSMGALLIRRVPKNPVGTLLLAVATVQVAGPALAAYAIFGGSAVPPWPGASIAAAFGDFMYIAPYVIALVGIPLLFPDGRLPSPRFRWVVWVTIVAMVAQLLPGLASLIPGLADLGAFGAIAGVASLVAALFGIGGAATAIWVRFRRGDPVQRQQLKWLLAVAAVAAVAFPVALVLEATWSSVAIAFWLIGYLAYLALPVAHRHRRSALPPVRDRPDHQSRARLRAADGDHRRHLCRFGGFVGARPGCGWPVVGRGDRAHHAGRGGHLHALEKLRPSGR